MRLGESWSHYLRLTRRSKINIAAGTARQPITMTTGMTVFTPWRELVTTALFPYPIYLPLIIQ